MVAQAKLGEATATLGGPRHTTDRVARGGPPNGGHELQICRTVAKATHPPRMVAQAQTRSFGPSPLVHLIDD